MNISDDAKFIPLVSVITLAFNSEKFIGGCIRSVQAQSYSRVEHIIVDAGSTDRTIEVIERYISSEVLNVPIRFVKTGYCSIPEARVLGVSSAKGELIAVLDSDDDWKQDKLAIQVGFFIKNSKLVICGSSIELHNIDKKTMRFFKFPEKDYVLRQLLRAGLNPFSHSAVMYRKSAYCSVGGYRVELKKAEDFGLWLSLSKVGQLTSVSQPLTKITVRCDSHTRAFEWEQYARYLAIALLGNELHGKNLSWSHVAIAVNKFSLDLLNILYVKSVISLIWKEPIILLHANVARLIVGTLSMKRKYILRAIINTRVSWSFRDFAKIYFCVSTRTSNKSY